MTDSRNRVLVGVGGGIAAYKICEVVSTLAKAGVEVRVILTDSAQQFVKDHPDLTQGRARSAAELSVERCKRLVLREKKDVWVSRT